MLLVQICVTTSIDYATNEDEESELINFVTVWKKKLQRKGYDLNTNQIYKFNHWKLSNRYNCIEHQNPRILKSQSLVELSNN